MFYCEQIKQKIILDKLYKHKTNDLLFINSSGARLLKLEEPIRPMEIFDGAA